MAVGVTGTGRGQLSLRVSSCRQSRDAMRCVAVRCDADIGQDSGGALFLTVFKGIVAPLLGSG